MARKKPEIPNDLVGIAGVHYVAFELSRRKVVVLPTTRNTAGYDIIAVSSDGTRHANIQVKTAQRRPNFWPMPHSGKIPNGQHDYFVLVRGIKKNPIECFFVTGKEARSEVRRVENRQRAKSGKVTFPCIYVAGKYALKAARERWKSACEKWTI